MFVYGYWKPSFRKILIYFAFIRKTNKVIKRVMINNLIKLIIKNIQKKIDPIKKQFYVGNVIKYIKNNNKRLNTNTNLAHLNI